MIHYTILSAGKVILSCRTLLLKCTKTNDVFDNDDFITEEEEILVQNLKSMKYPFLNNLPYYAVQLFHSRRLQ